MPPAICPALAGGRWQALAVTSPLAAIASDGLLQGGRGHARTAGTYARIRAHSVRETGALALVDAMRTMTLMPALRLERRAPALLLKSV
jgi:hypothetical protein